MSSSAALLERPGLAASFRRNARVFFVGGAIAYRALFNWIRPSIYIPTMLGSPLFQILFFTKLGDFAGVRNDAFFVVGNAVQACAMAGIYGATMAIGNERWMGTLSPLLATPTNRLALFLGRSLPYIANGVLVSLFGLGVGIALLDFSPPLSALFPLLSVIVITATACTSTGLLLGSIGLRARDVFFVSNLMYFAMLLFCGVNIPLDALPGWMQVVGNALPVTHGIQAARAVADGQSFASVVDLIGAELLVGVIYGLLAYVLFRYLEAESRRRASLESF